MLQAYGDPLTYPAFPSLPFSNCFQITSGLNISAHLPYLIPLLALSLLIPDQHRTSLLTPALIAGSFLLTSSFTFLGIQSLRTACTDWLGNEPFSAAAKLLLVAALISSELLSSVNLSVIVVAAVNYLSGTRDACSSGTAVRVGAARFPHHFLDGTQERKLTRTGFTRTDFGRCKCAGKLRFVVRNDGYAEPSGNCLMMA